MIVRFGVVSEGSYLTDRVYFVLVMRLYLCLQKNGEMHSVFGVMMIIRITIFSSLKGRERLKGMKFCVLSI